MSSMKTGVAGGMATGRPCPEITDKKDGTPLSRDGAPGYPAPRELPLTEDRHSGRPCTDNSVADSPRGP